MPPRETERLRVYLIDLLTAELHPPMRGHGPDWEQIAIATGIDPELMLAVRDAVRPGLDALERTLKLKRVPRSRQRVVERRRPIRARHVERPPSATVDQTRHTPEGANDLEAPAKPRRTTGVPPRPVVEFPEPKWTDWVDPPGFAAALSLHMQRHADTAWSLHRAVVKSGETFDHATLRSWRNGRKSPRGVESFEILARIERRYRLPIGYFKRKLPHPARATTGFRPANISAAERRRLAWHLPDDFDGRPTEEQEEILAWVRSVIVSGSTEYRRFQAAAMRQRYAVRFRSLMPLGRSGSRPARPLEDEGPDLDRDDIDPEPLGGVVDAPAALEGEMAELIRFKTATLTTFGYQRTGVWNEETAAQKVEHLGLMFGALAASPRAAVRGFGAPLDALCFGMLVFPAVWDWYVQWRERRRGFYTGWEAEMLRIGLALTRKDTGWIRQTPGLADRLSVIAGLIDDADIKQARTDWDAVCDRFQKHGAHRLKEIVRVARVHRDPFEPILPVLESESPVGAYRRITEEIVRLMPSERLYPLSAAEVVRSFLMLRLGLHLGVRQKNLRQLLVCPRGHQPRSERQLEDMKRGELRWSERDRGWEVIIPSVAFKNATSSFFGSKPFRLVLPDLAGLYEMIDAWLDRHRRRLLGPARDPSTFFVKTAKISSTDAAYDQNTFYEAWRLVTQRYGVFNPYTGRGAIPGLLPHGPHNVRDVLATHILKVTGSYEQASYAIQDTPEMVAKHYGRFLPQDKAALAAQILNRVWEAA